jgi:hypothetical protein
MDGLTVSDSQAGGVTAQIQNSNSTQTGGSRLDFLYSGSTVTGRIQNRFNGGDFQTDWYTGNHGLEIFTDLAKTEKRLDIANNGDISFYEDTGTTPKFFWDASAESLGIGTTSPSAKLDVELGTTGTIAEFRGGDSDILQIKNENDLIVFDTRNTASGLAFQMQGTERMRMDSSGNATFNTTNISPAVNNVNGTALLQYGGASMSRNNSTTIELNRGSSDGAIIGLRKDGTTVGSISVTASATAYNTSSDERLKENIQDAEDAGSKIDAIQIRQFDWKSDGTHQDYGVVAQELVTVAPEAVHQPEDEEEMMSVDYSKLVPTLIKEIQSLRNRVAQLENN